MKPCELPGAGNRVVFEQRYSSGAFVQTYSSRTLTHSANNGVKHGGLSDRLTAQVPSLVSRELPSCVLRIVIRARRCTSWALSYQQRFLDAAFGSLYWKPTAS